MKFAKTLLSRLALSKGAKMDVVEARFAQLSMAEGAGKRRRRSVSPFAVIGRAA
ncbi:MAG: hypothetical protein R3D78_08740 [Paracoccaceae bacterium]